MSPESDPFCAVSLFREYSAGGVGNMGSAGRAVARRATPPYSLRRASTGSRRLAALDGMRPAISVSTTEMHTSTAADVHGRLMMFSTAKPSSTAAFTGMETATTKAIAKRPEMRPSMKVSALKTLATLRLEAPMA